jgi:hypothetical protein
MGKLYFVVFLIAAETLLPPTLTTGLDFIGLRLPLIFGPCLCIFLVVGRLVTNRLGSDITSLRFSLSKQVFAGVLNHGIHQVVGIHYTSGNL